MLDSQCILKGEPSGFADGLDVEYKRESRVNVDSKGFTLGRWKEGLDIA